MKANPVSAFFYVLGGLTFLKFVTKTLVVFSETFVLPGTNVSAIVEIVHGGISQFQLSAEKVRSREGELGR